MNITGQPASSLLDSVLNAQTTREDIGVTMLKKAEDTERQQGDATVQMLEQTGAKPGSQGQLLDTYA
jgi:hypothetical protein